MKWVRYQLGPREERRAARAAAWIYFVSAAAVLISNLTVSRGMNFVNTVVVVPVPLSTLGILLSWSRFRYTWQLLLLTPLVANGFELLLDLQSHDASPGAQVAFCLPVLFAASQLRVLGAVVTAVSAIGCDAVVVWQLQHDLVGAIDLFDVALVVTLMTGLLLAAGLQQERLVAMLESRASLDSLTGLATRRVLDQAAQQALSTPSAAAGVALVLVDIDFFKLINDNYGHPVGDDALVHVAQLLAQLARPNTVISRLGGDEIAVLLPDCPEPVALKRAQEFLLLVRDSPMTLATGEQLAISVSVGLAHAPRGDAKLRDLYVAADASLYQAKQHGRGRVGGSVHS